MHHKKKILAIIICLLTLDSIAQTKFEPTYESLKQYECPEWFRDAKFGIWAHWGPQSVPEHGDWYARIMYLQDLSGFGSTRPYEHHLKNFGHPSEFGYKDLIPLFTAEKWDPEKLMKLYKKAGARYFVSMGQHHDNFDMWDSKLQPWNAVNMGPKRDIVKEWQTAAKNNDMAFGVSFHGKSAWKWFETSRLSDYKGEKKGVPYDGWLTKEDGKGKWWEGYDPQDLYGEPHKPTEPTRVIWQDKSDEAYVMGDVPSKAYNEKFEGRVYDIIDNYKPELLYFDGHNLFEKRETESEMLSYLYNKSQDWNNGTNNTVVASKRLTEKEQQMWVLDYENSHSGTLRELPWQTDIGFDWWFYHKRENESGMKTQDVIHTLIDIVSKNGNMLLNICQKANGEILPYSYIFLEEMSNWMDINSEAIHGTRPWIKFGEGPRQIEGDKNKVHEVIDYTSEDFRFTTKGNALYAILMGYPEDKKEVVVTSIPSTGKLWFGKINTVELLGFEGKIDWKQTENGLLVSLPDKQPCEYAYVIKISGN